MDREGRRNGIASAIALTLFVTMTLGAGRVVLADKPFPAGEDLSFKTGGTGVFVPANLGVGVAGGLGIIGDGSGLATYDGTPTGKEFHLNGKRVGDGWDRHFGAAQSTGPEFGEGDEAGLVFYPEETAPNPDGSGRAIHIMESDEGQIFFTYGGAFELDLDALTLTYSSDFTVVGGTGIFAGSTGTVHVTTTTSLADGDVDFDLQSRQFSTTISRGLLGYEIKTGKGAAKGWVRPWVFFPVARAGSTQTRSTATRRTWVPSPQARTRLVTLLIFSPA